MHSYKKLFLFSLLFCIGLFSSQSRSKDSLRGNFTYLLKAKLNTQLPNYIHEESFSLLISDKYAFFVSSKSLKRDSVLDNSRETRKNSDGSITLSIKKGVSIPETQFYFTIIQSNENIQYFDSAFMSLLTYKEPVIKNWKLIDETKIINTINCKKAEVTFKGRNWVAWYASEIPFPYGPMKFSGLPGLIIKIADDKGDYDFELVKSVAGSQLKGKLIDIKKSRYTGAVETTQSKLKQAKKDAEANAAGLLASYGTTVIKGKEILRQREKEREENSKYANPLELTN